MNTETDNYKFKEWARQLYTERDKTIREASLITGIDEAAIRKWSNEELWDSRKCSLLTSKDAQLKHIYRMLGSLGEKMTTTQESTPKEVDAYLKYTNAIKNLEGELTVSLIIQANAEFITWMRERDIELTRIITMQFDAFVKEKLAPTVC